MPTYNEKFLGNLLCLEESEMSDKIGWGSWEEESPINLVKIREIT
jgi:hypothetical protein